MTDSVTVGPANVARMRRLVREFEQLVERRETFNRPDDQGLRTGRRRAWHFRERGMTRPAWLADKIAPGPDWFSDGMRVYGRNLTAYAGLHGTIRTARPVRRDSRDYVVVIWDVFSTQHYYALSVRASSLALEL